MHAEVFVILKRGALNVAVETLVVGLRLGHFLDLVAAPVSADIIPHIARQAAVVLRLSGVQQCYVQPPVGERAIFLATTASSLRYGRWNARVRCRRRGAIPAKPVVHIEHWRTLEATGIKRVVPIPIVFDFALKPADQSNFGE